MNRTAAYCVCLIALSLLARPGAAHPMGNFSINHYARLHCAPRGIDLMYVLDMAEIPTVAEKSVLDADGNGAISSAEGASYTRGKCAELAARLHLTVDGTPAAVLPQDARLELRPGAASLDTLRLSFHASIPLSPNEPATGARIVYRDDNYPERTGWKEIVVNGGNGATVTGANLSTADRSRELTVYPTGPAAVTPQQTDAQFCVQQSGDHTAAKAITAAPALSATANRATPQDAFTQSVAAVRLTPAVVVLSLSLALLFGGLHALSPGHGKAMVAAYLVGTRGTVRHAVLLGLVVTLTHTVVVYVIGLITLVASRYVVPERLYPVISVLSGAMVLCIGLGMLALRIRALVTAHRRDRIVPAIEDDMEGWERFASDAEPAAVMTTAAPASGTDAELSTGALIALGISGGALPCPSALVVLLSATAMHRIGFGMLLIVVYSFGLATVLTGIGILVVKARGVIGRLPSSGRVVAALPIFSAAAITVIGCYLLIGVWASR